MLYDFFCHRLKPFYVYKKDKFFKSLSKSIKTSSKKNTFLFVHGYNTSFSEAAKRTAQISYDLMFEGKAVFYSWPSQSSMFKYPQDELNIELDDLNLYIKDLTENSINLFLSSFK